MSGEPPFEDLTFYVHEEPPPKPAGVTTGWIVVHRGVGPGSAMRVQMLVDEDGQSSIVPDGEFQPVTITDD